MSAQRTKALADHVALLLAENKRLRAENAALRIAGPNARIWRVTDAGQAALRAAKDDHA